MKQAYGYVVITAFLFGTMEVACKIAGNNLDSLQLTALRFLLGGLVLLPFGLREIKGKGVKLNGKDWLTISGLGILCVAVSMVFFQLAVMSCNASTISVLFCVNPLFTMVFAHIFTEEKLNKNKIIALAIAITGIVFLMRPWDIQSGNNVLGFVLIILAAITFSYYTIAARNISQKIGAVAQTSLCFIIGSVVLIIVMAIIGKPIVEGVMDNIPILIYTGIAISGIGYCTYFQAIKLADAATGSYAFFLKAAIAPILAAIVLHEVVLWNTVLGIVLMLVASFINITQKKMVTKNENNKEKHQISS